MPHKPIKQINNASHSSWRSRLWLPWTQKIAQKIAHTLARLDGVLLWTIVAISLLPLIPLFTSWFEFDGQLWQHLWQTQLPELLGNTISLMLIVGVTSFLLGTSLAWLVVMYDFPGRNLLQWGLMLPLAIPPYIFAFVLLGFTDYQGPLQKLLQIMGLGVNWLPDIRNVWGVGLVFSLSLYPYVYLLMRSALQRKGRTSYESARTLGYSKAGAFWRLVIPLTRPAWIAGLALVLMETLADFGAVSIFNFDTFTTAIYKSWFGFFSASTAAQLACILLLFVALSVIAEKWGRGQSRYDQSGSSLKHYRQPLSEAGAWGYLAQFGAWFIFALGFVLPISQLLFWAISSFDHHTQGTLDLLWHTVLLAVAAALMTLLVAAIMVWALVSKKQSKKNSKSNGLRQAGAEIAQLGYALPGTVLAVGIMLMLNYFDDAIAAMTGVKGQWLAAGVFALLLAYVIRFLRIGYGPLASSMGQIKPSVIEAARSLGADQKERVTRVYIPLLRPGVLTALLLVFVEVMKEMPATLLLRPFGWDTLAVRIYELTSEGEWQLAALPGVLLVAIGILPVIYLIKKSEV
ncbi:MAG: iron ABC transporter permease [Kangiellaceae bacterium]|nr:iron ABC transporter permease [Kangiellaceae bacterium]